MLCAMTRFCHYTKVTERGGIPEGCMSGTVQWLCHLLHAPCCACYWGYRDKENFSFLPSWRLHSRLWTNERNVCINVHSRPVARVNRVYLEGELGMQLGWVDEKNNEPRQSFSDHGSNFNVQLWIYRKAQGPIPLFQLGSVACFSWTELHTEFRRQSAPQGSGRKI